MDRKINLFALVAGVLTLVLIAVSVYVPWWQLLVGNPLVEVNFSPVNLNFSLLGNLLTVPLIWALNIASLLTLAVGGIVMLIYSVVPTKPYAKQLIGFGYKKPLYAVILFLVELVGLYLSVKLMLGFDLPLMGSAILNLPASIAPGGANIGITVSSALMWPFYLAVVVVALCIIARVYHGRVSQSAASIPPPPA